MCVFGDSEPGSVFDIYFPYLYSIKTRASRLQDLLHMCRFDNLHVETCGVDARFLGCLELSGAIGHQGWAELNPRLSLDKIWGPCLTRL